MAAGDPVPWSYIATRVATVPLTTNSATWTTTETGALITASPTLVAGSTYKITLVAKVSSTVTSDVSFMRIREDSATGSQLDGCCVFIGSPTSNGYPLTMYTEYTAAGSGVKNFVVTGQRIGGTGTHQISCSVNRPVWFTVDLIPS